MKTIYMLIFVLKPVLIVRPSIYKWPLPIKNAYIERWSGRFIRRNFSTDFATCENYMSSVLDYESPCKNYWEKSIIDFGPTPEILRVLLKYNQSKDFEQINCWQGSLFTVTLYMLSVCLFPNLFRRSPLHALQHGPYLLGWFFFLKSQFVVT